jgi:hypothetical protein
MEPSLTQAVAGLRPFNEVLQCYAWPGPTR